MRHPLIFDTETTGLLDWSLPADHADQPRMCSLAFKFIGEPVVYRLVRPEGWEFDNHSEAATVNGLTHERLMDEGDSLAKVLDEFDAAVDACDLIAGFSIAYDQKIIRGECRRLGRPDRYGDRPTFDTMYKGRTLASRAGNGKARKLTEIYRAVTGQELADAHDARADVLATEELFNRLAAEGMVEPRAQTSKGGFP